MTTGATKRTMLRHWVGVCCLVWTLSKVGAEDAVSGHRRYLSGNENDYIGSFGELENWEAAVQRIFGIEESDSVCDAADKPSCKCIKQNCGCCLGVKLPKISVVGNCCVNVSYLSEKFGFKMSFSFNDRILFEHEVSVQNPPTLCVGVPVIKRALSVCINFYNLHRKNRTLCGCVKVGFRLALYQKLFKIGCFGVPIGDGEEAERRADLIVRSFADAAQRESRWEDIDT